MDPGTAIAVATLSTKVVSLIWKYSSDFKNAQSSITLLANEIEAFKQVMLKLEELLKKSSNLPALGSLETTLKQALLDVENLERKLRPGKGAKTMERLGKRLKWPLDKKEVEDWITTFQRLKATVNLALNTDTTSFIIGVDANVVQVKQNQDIVDQERLLGKLPFAAGASFDSYHRQHERQCMEDTRVGLLQQFQEWGANHSRPLFWVSGMAGTGKSTIARTLANRFKSSGTLGGSFFFSRASGEANNAFKLVGTLAHHLANALPHLKGPLCEAILNHEDVVRQGLRNQWKELIVTPLSNVRLNGRPTLNIVIDALDECGSDDDIRLILQLFVEVKDLKSIDMGIFVTSRPEIVIRLGFANIPDIVHQKLDLRDIPRDDVEHDIMVFLESELRCISLQRKLHDWPSKHAIGVLVKRSDCLFIYATTACRYIGGMDWDPEERLSEILSGGSSGEGDAITGIDAMYMQVLRTALTEGRGQKEVDKLCDRFKQVVGSIVVLFDELSISALAGLLSLQENSVKLSLDGLHSVLNVLDDTDSPVRLLHPSFHDFLVDYRRCEDGRFCVDEASMHGELAKNCLRVISTALKRNMCQLSTPGAPPQEAERHTLNIQLPRHVQYACSYWVDHLASTKPDSRLQIGFCDNGEVHLFFQKDFLRWLEAMSLMEKMPQAVLMIQKLANILEVRQHHDLRAMVHDASRFIRSNRAIIEEAPLQTYASALVFSPTESLIRKCYLDQLPRWLTRRPKVDKRWGNRLQSLEFNGYSTSAMAFSPDSRYLACGVKLWESDKHIIQLFDATTGALHTTLEGHNDTVDSATFLRDGTLASVGQDGTLRIWEPVTGVTRRILDIDFRVEDAYPKQQSLSLLVLPNGDLVVLCLDRNVRIWSWKQASFSQPLLLNCPVHALRGWLPQGMLVFEGVRTESDIVETLLFDSNTSAVQSLVIDSPGKFRAIAVSSENMVAYGSEDGTIVLYHPAKGRHSRLGEHPSGVAGLGFSPNGRILVSAGSDATLRSWNLSTQASNLIGVTLFISNLVGFSPNGKQIATSQGHFPIELWDLPSTATENLHEPVHDSIASILYSPGGNHVATISYGEDTIRLYDTVTEALSFTLVGHLDAVEKLKFSPDGKRLASGSRDETIRLWDPQTGMRDKVLGNNLGFVDALAFSSDGGQLASTSREGEIRIWDPDTGDLHHTLKLSPPAIYAKNLFFSFDGKRIAAAFASRDDKTHIRLWDTNTGQLLNEIGIARRSAAISPNCRFIVYASPEGKIALYDIEKKEQRATFDSSTGSVLDLAFSMDNTSFASCSYEGNVELWDVRTARRIRFLPVQLWTRQLSFSADGTYLETGRGHVQILQVDEDTSNGSSKPLSFWRYRDDGWIMEGSRKMLWLPLNWRLGEMSAYYNGLFAFRHDGGLAFMGFTQGKVPTNTDGNVI